MSVNFSFDLLNKDNTFKNKTHFLNPNNSLTICITPNIPLARILYLAMDKIYLFYLCFTHAYKKNYK